MRFRYAFYGILMFEFNSRISFDSLAMREKLRIYSAAKFAQNCHRPQINLSGGYKEPGLAGHPAFGTHTQISPSYGVLNLVDIPITFRGSSNTGIRFLSRRLKNCRAKNAPIPRVIFALNKNAQNRRTGFPTVSENRH